MSESGDVTEILQQTTAGDRVAADTLLPLVYDELRRLAQKHLQAERPDHTLQATALVHEVYLKLCDQTRVEWKNRAHFLAIAAQAIRRILVDHARARGRQKRSGSHRHFTIDDQLLVAQKDNDDLLALDEVMKKLGEEHPDKASVVEMRYFGGLTNDEAAEVLGVTTRTIERHWQFARTWLYRELTGNEMDT